MKSEELSMFPEGYQPLTSASRRMGSLHFATSDDPAVFYIVARGFITPSLITEELPLAEAFGTKHPEGWSYIVDTTGVVMIHPFNLPLLRAVHRLPNIREYIIIAPPVVRLLARAAALILRPTSVLSAPEEALRLVAERVVSESGKR